LQRFPPTGLLPRRHYLRARQQSPQSDAVSARLALGRKQRRRIPARCPGDFRGCTNHTQQLSTRTRTLVRPFLRQVGPHLRRIDTPSRGILRAKVPRARLTAGHFNKGLGSREHARVQLAHASVARLGRPRERTLDVLRTSQASDHLTHTSRSTHETSVVAPTLASPASGLASASLMPRATCTMSTAGAPNARARRIR